MIRKIQHFIFVLLMCFPVGLQADQREAGAATRVAILGDSLVAGYGLQTEYGLVPRLKIWLSEQASWTSHPIDLVNAGVSGDTTSGGASRMAWTLSPDIDAVVIALGGNDYLRAVPPNLVRQNLEAMILEAKELNRPVMMVNFPVGPNYGAAYQAEFNAAYTDLARIHDVPLATGFFTSLIVAAGEPAELVSYLQNDNIHPNRRGVDEIIEVFGPELVSFVKNQL